MIGIKINEDEKYVYVSMNYRHIIENNWLEDLQYLCEPTEYHEQRVTVKFICDRGVSHEFVRHRVFSFAQESTRYCNYSKNKFGNEITYIIPSWINNEKQINISLNYTDIIGEDEGSFYWKRSLSTIESVYFSLLNLGKQPQEARSVLPNSLKTELIMTGFISDWKHFFELRDSKQAHPDARALAKPLHDKFIELNLI